MRSPFSRRTDYAIRAAVEIARHDGARVKRHPIAAAIDAPATVVAQALADLVRGGIVYAARAAPAATCCRGRPTQLTVADVVAAVEVDPEPRCVLEERGCADAAPCALHATLYEAHDAFTGRLATQSLASLAGLEPAKPAATADAPAAHHAPVPRRPPVDASRSRPDRAPASAAGSTDVSRPAGSAWPSATWPLREVSRPAPPRRRPDRRS